MPPVMATFLILPSHLNTLSFRSEARNLVFVGNEEKQVPPYAATVRNDKDISGSKVSSR
jgi:hypothetical protein